jgi:hypothetical protein
MSILNDIYDSKINFRVDTFWHGMTVRLGDEINGIKAETDAMEWGEAEAWLKDQAIRHFPDSRFAMMYRDGLSADEADARLRKRGEEEESGSAP